MRYSVAPLSKQDIASAMGILLRVYETEREVNPLLPPRMMGSNSEVELFLLKAIANGAVGLVSDGRMIGFMAISALFQFKGQRAALIGEVCHGTSVEDRLGVYQSLYEALGEHLDRQKARVHIVSHFANDRSLQEALYRLGFGAFLAERIRDLSKVSGAAEVELSQEEDFTSIQDLEAEHMRYYRKPPIYLRKDDSTETVRAGLIARQEHGDALFVYREKGRPMAYFVVGKCTGNQDGRILRNTNTAQLMSAYASPSTRERGIGKALLNRSIEWSHSQGFSRLFVEHETANIYGGNFWRKHFSPYLYFSMRYIEECV